ncbi:hypothetical protein Cgig2_005355 [Carnegiea gigantea]|uniref:RRM domain-containing protein n=1 Tax=Carnegiea gigantea TaxID=171969 RepID=A0A9Q1K709_9CARY|nr:hypothetical protein Cgig2_005355 [Carnegiea gigantea]
MQFLMGVFYLLKLSCADWGMEPGKIFVGGISWDTNEDRLRGYFQTFGEVVEAVIMKDRATGRARGFGFVIYADPAVAELVVRQKHIVDGRTVEAKKAVPRDDQHIVNRNQGSPTATPIPVRTKKIFVGGLPSTVTEADFKRYFDQFGTITDVVVMYDHNTQRPRGFGFITYDSEEAVERALVKTFHELNGKLVEVKRAVPKELSPGPNRSPLGIGSSNLCRLNSFINSYGQGYNPNSIAGHGINIDERQSPLSFARGGLPPFSPSNYGTPLNYDRRMSPSYGEAANFFPKLSYEQGFNGLQSSNVSRNASFADQFDGVKRGSAPSPNPSWSLWGNGSISDTSFRVGDIEPDAFKSREAIWGSSPLSLQPGARGSLSNGGLNLSHGRENLDLGSVAGLYGRDLRTRIPLAASSSSSFGSLYAGYETKFDNLYSGGGEQSWPSPALGLKGSDWGMEKIFVGGISWDTNEDRLREYFQNFGEVVEAVIMKDRATGRERGFGFVVYAEPAVAELVVRQKHIIDGRTVEAKKAVPRDDQHILNRNQSSPIASPVPVRTKKIFVGGLASTVTEADFRRYFDQFGTITDVVVMYDHNTQRPRGFGFITYDSEEAAERALVKTFHEVNGKMVEVKQAVPKELSSGPNRSPLGIGSSSLVRVNSFINGYGQGYNPSPIAGHGINIDERHSPLSYARSGLLPFSPSNFGTVSHYEQRMSPSYGEAANLFPKLNHEQGFNGLQTSNVTWHGSLASQFDIVSRGSGPPNPGSSSWSLWGNGSMTDTSFRVDEIMSNPLKNREAIWGAFSLSVQQGARASLSNGSVNLSRGRENVDLGSLAGLYGRDLRTRIPPASSYGSLDAGNETKFDKLYGGGGECSWPSPALGLKGYWSSEFGLGNGVADVPLNNPAALCW